MKRLGFLLALLLLAVPAPAAAQDYAACWISSTNQIKPCPGNVRLKSTYTLGASYLPSAIPATLLGNGDVDNTKLSYLSTLTGNVQTQLAGLQPLDADLTAIAALNSTGILARTGTNTWALRTLTQGTGITVSNGDGSGGNPTVSLATNSLTIAAGTGLSMSGCSPVALGGTCTPSIAATAVSAGNYPTSGQVPTFTVDAQGRLTAAGSTTTLTSPAISAPVLSGSATGTYTLAGTPTITSPTISGPTLSGTVAGTYTIGGTPTLGVNLAAGGFKVTGLGTPTASSSDAATATYAEAQKTGSAIRLYTSASISANQYIGSFGQTSNATPSQVGGFCVPVAGKLKAIAVTGFNNASSNTTVTVYQSSDHANTYSSTSLAVTVSSGTAGNTATSTVTAAANDCFIALVDAAWTVSAGQWWQATLQYVPN